MVLINLIFTPNPHITDMNPRKKYKPTNSIEEFKKQVEEKLEEKRREKTPFKNYFALPKGDAGIVYGSIMLLLTTLITQKALGAGVVYYIADIIVSLCAFTYVLGKRHDATKEAPNGVMHVVRDTDEVFEEMEQPAVA